MIWLALLFLIPRAFACISEMPECRSLSIGIKLPLPFLAAGIFLVAIMAYAARLMKKGKTSALAGRAAKLLLGIGVVMVVAVFALPDGFLCKLLPPKDCTIHDNCGYNSTAADLDKTWIDVDGCTHVCNYEIVDGKKVPAMLLC